VRSSGIAGELWAYLRERKKWWLAPVIAVMLLVGALLVFAQGSALAPFIYTIF
jgi:drug/metabolite transporter superfamily protein YnfA